MTEAVKVRVKFHVAKGRTGHKLLREGPAPEPAVREGHTPRISQLMALAIRFEQLIKDGVVKDQADVARLALISRARVTQIMDLLTLAPEIQEALLFLPPVFKGRDPIRERDVRKILIETEWERQWAVCQALPLSLAPLAGPTLPGWRSSAAPA